MTEGHEPDHAGSSHDEHPRVRAGQKRREAKRTKPESEIRGGKNYPSQLPENRGEYDPATTRTPQGGGPD